MHHTENISEFHKDKQVRGRNVRHTQMLSEFTSSESPDITSAQSCFLLKALSSRWASPRVVTYGKGNHIYKRMHMQAHTRHTHEKKKLSKMTICQPLHPDCNQTGRSEEWQLVSIQLQ